MNQPAAISSSDVLGTIPVVREDVRVDKSIETTGVVRVRLESLEVSKQVPLASVRSTASIERVVRDTAVDERRAPWHEGDVLVIPVYEERVVTERRLFLKEEIRVSSTVRRDTVVEAVALRRDRAVVERLQPDGSWREEDVDGASSDVGAPARFDDTGFAGDPMLGGPWPESTTHSS